MGLLAGLRGDILELSAAGNGRCRLIAAALLVEKQVPGAPVVDEEGALVGIISLRDISKARKANAMKAPLTAYMAKRLVCCAPGDTIREVERRMLGKNVGHLPIVEGTRLVGIITSGDYKRFYS